MQNPNLQSSTQYSQQAQQPLYSSQDQSQLLIQYKDARSIIWSAIDHKQQQQVQPQLLRIKNNILLALLGLSAYGIFYVIGGFIDYLIIGYVTGLAYHQTRTKFTRFVLNSRSYMRKCQPFPTRLWKCLLLLLLAFILPRLRYMLIYPQQFKHCLSFNNYLQSFHKNKNLTVIIFQILIGVYVIYLLLVPYLKKLAQIIKPKSKRVIEFMFGCFVLLFGISAVILIPVVLFKEVGEVGFLIQQKIQQKLQCQIISFGQHANSTLPSCSQKVAENSLIKQTIEQFRNQNQTVQKCKQYINNLQLDYIGHNVFHYDEITCTWYSFIAKATNYSAIHSQTQDISTASIFSTGTNIFKDVFGNLTKFLMGVSNFVFCFTIWLTTFLLTTNLPNRYMTIKKLFSENKAEFVSGITKLTNATCMIVFWHFIASLILLQLFNFTPINLIISILLSLMAFIPLFRPWFGILIVCAIRAIFLHRYSELLISLIFVGLYYSVSEKIYSFYYSKLQVHQIITNLAVLFGIYRFGISGIFYGPLILILYTCIEKELYSNYGRSPNSKKTLSQQQQSPQKSKTLTQKQHQQHQNPPQLSKNSSTKQQKTSQKTTTTTTATINKHTQQHKNLKKTKNLKNLKKRQSQQYYLSHGSSQQDEDKEREDQSQLIQESKQSEEQDELKPEHQYYSEDNQIPVEEIVQQTIQNSNSKNKKNNSKKNSVNKKKTKKMKQI